MRRVLIDSHILIWLLKEPELLSKSARELVESAEAEVYVSVASLLELGFKYRKGKLPYSVASLRQGASETGLVVMEMRAEHAEAMEQVVKGHADPFDVMLLAQAQSEQCIFLTADKALLGLGSFVIDARK